MFGGIFFDPTLNVHISAYIVGMFQVWIGFFL